MPCAYRSSLQPVPSAAGSNGEVQLCIMVAPGLRDQLRKVAAARGLTLRAVVLQALRDAGVLPDMADADLADRRAVLAAAKARLWHEHTAADSRRRAATATAVCVQQKPAREGFEQHDAPRQCLPRTWISTTWALI